MSVSPSGSIAVMGLPILVPLSVFSAIVRVILLPSVNTETSFTLETLIVTVMDTLPVFPSETLTIPV